MSKKYELEPFAGTVENISEKENRIVLLIEDMEGDKEFHSAWDGIPEDLEEGSTVMVKSEAVEKNGRTFYNIKDIELADIEDEKPEDGEAPRPSPPQGVNVRVEAAYVASEAVFLHDVDKDSAAAFVGFCRRIERYLRNGGEG